MMDPDNTYKAPEYPLPNVSPVDQIKRIARTYGHAGCEPGTHLFCRLVEAIGAMGQREQEHLLRELRGGA